MCEYLYEQLHIIYYFDFSIAMNEFNIRDLPQ